MFLAQPRQARTRGRAPLGAMIIAADCPGVMWNTIIFMKFDRRSLLPGIAPAAGAAPVAPMV